MARKRNLKRVREGQGDEVYEYCNRSGGPHPRPLPQSWGRGDRTSIRRLAPPLPELGEGAGGEGLNG